MALEFIESGRAATEAPPTIEKPEVLKVESGRQPAELNAACVVCGPMNPRGLQIRFHHDSGAVSAEWTPTADWEGFPRTIHGGIISTVLDEAMSKAVIASGWDALTAELKIRFRGRVSPGEELHVKGWIKENRKRRILAEAMLTTRQGVERAHGWATFLTLTSSSINSGR